MNKFMHDNQGSESSLRLMMAWSFIVVFAVWGAVSLIKVELVDLPTQIALVVMAILTAKVWQKSVENKAPPVDKEPCAPTDTPAP